MMIKVIFAIILIGCVAVNSVFGLFDPLSMGLAAGAALGLYKFDTVKDQTYCRFTECCNERYIHLDIDGLRTDLKTILFGQHIVLQQLLPALNAHVSNSRKPLVLSFHGTAGTGKNYVSDMIAKRLYTNGLQSKFVHKYLGRSDFPLDSMTDVYSARLSTEVRDAIAACPQSLFIFDEVDKMPPKVFESLTSLVNYNPHVKGVDTSQAIFIFLSNTAGVHLSDKLGQLMKAGTLRENTKMSDFEPILEKGAYNLDGGLKKASLIESHVIDHFIPFLPLEKTHVIGCVKKEFNYWGKFPKDDVIQNVVNDIITFDRTHGIFATAGCKKIDKKVAVEAYNV